VIFCNDCMRLCIDSFQRKSMTILLILAVLEKISRDIGSSVAIIDKFNVFEVERICVSYDPPPS
jgi:hypothetical protein